MGLISKIANYGWRALKIMPEMAFGTSAEVFGQGVRSAAKGSSVWTRIKSGAKAVEDASNKGGGFFKRTGKSIITLPTDMVKDVRKGVLHAKWVNRQLEKKLGATTAKTLAKSPFWGGVKGIFKTLGRRMPLIGVIAIAWSDGPNIFRAFKDGGFGAGMKEILGTGIELGGMAAGTAIGSLICPPVGTIVGGFVGALVGSKLRGKTYTEKKELAEQEAKVKANQFSQEDIQKLKQIGFTDEEIAQAQQLGYTPAQIYEALGLTTKAEPAVSTDVAKQIQPQQTQQAQQQWQVPESLKQQAAATNPFATGNMQKVDTNAILNQVYSNIGLNTGITNPNTSYTNPYSNDMLYKQVFGAGNYNLSLDTSVPTMKMGNDYSGNGSIFNQNQPVYKFGQ